MEASNPRAVVGNNSSDEKPADVAFRYLVLAMNKCRTEQQGLASEEKEIKLDLKERGLSPRSLAIARRAAGSNKISAEDAIAQAEEFLNDDKYRADREAFVEIKDARKELGLRMKELRDAAKVKGIRLDVLSLVRRIGETMDSQERKDFYDKFGQYSLFLKYW